MQKTVWTVLDLRMERPGSISVACVTEMTVLAMTVLVMVVLTMLRVRVTLTGLVETVLV
jgi:hypothetical protein